MQLIFRTYLIIDSLPNHTPTKKDLKEENLTPTFKNQQEKVDTQQQLQYNVVRASVDAGMHAFVSFLLPTLCQLTGIQQLTR